MEKSVMVVWISYANMKVPALEKGTKKKEEEIRKRWETEEEMRGRALTDSKAQMKLSSGEQKDKESKDREG